MAEKLMWGTALLMYGLAAVLLWNFHWSFWVAVGLGTVAATVGNSLRAAAMTLSPAHLVSAHG